MGEEMQINMILVCYIYDAMKARSQHARLDRDCERHSSPKYNFHPTPASIQQVVVVQSVFRKNLSPKDQ